MRGLEFANYGLFLIPISGAQAVFSDHLRERTWTKWLSNRSRAITNQEGIFDMMKAIAGSLTRKQHQEAVELLQQSPIWLEKRQLFKNWFTNKWLSEEKVCSAHVN